jgi:hypothetical protein
LHLSAARVNERSTADDADYGLRRLCFLSNGEQRQEQYGSNEMAFHLISGIKAGNRNRRSKVHSKDGATCGV